LIYIIQPLVDCSKDRSRLVESNWRIQRQRAFKHLELFASYHPSFKIGGWPLRIDLSCHLPNEIRSNEGYKNLRGDIAGKLGREV